MHSLSDLLRPARSVLLLFVDPNCGPCVALLEEVRSWLEDTGERGLIVIAGTRGPNPGHERLRVASGVPGDRILIQQAREVAEAFQIAGTPAAVLLERDGVVAAPIAYGADAIRTLHLRQHAAMYLGPMVSARPAAVGR